MAGFYWEVDPKTGDYVMEDGAPKITDSLKIPSYIRLKTKRGAWLYAPDTEYGSDFHLMKKRRSSENASTIEDAAARALQPIVDDGRATEIEVETQVLTRNNVGMKVDIIDSTTERVETLVLPAI